MKFKPTHFAIFHKKTILVQLLHETTYRQGMRVQRNAVCYVDESGEVTTRDKAEFDRIFQSVTNA